MENEFVIIPSRRADFTEIDDDEIELSRKSVLGKIFRKEILRKGPLIHPRSNKVINIDDDFVKTLRQNFHDGVCDIVQVPVADDDNKHTEDPFRNIGEVIDIEEQGDKVYALIDVRDEVAASKLGKTLLGASAMMDLNHIDTRDGLPKGPTLIHACVTNNPYMLGLGGYEQIVSATSDSSNSVVLLSNEEPEVSEAKSEEKEMPKTLEELLAQLKEEHGIDVTALQETTAKQQKDLEDATALSNTLTGQVEEATTKLSDQDAAMQKLAADLSSVGVVKLSNQEFTLTDVVTAVGELSSNHLMLTAHVQELREKDARIEVEGKREKGFVTPDQVDGFVELKLTNPAMYEKLMPKTKLVELNKETGVTPEDPNPELNLDEYVTKLTSPGGAAYEFINRGKNRQ